MTKNHLKRIAVPLSWHVPRKTLTFITRPNPGSHNMMLGTSLVVVLRDLLSLGTTKKEITSILQHKNVQVDGVQRKDLRFSTGLLDVVGFPDIDAYYRILLSPKGRLITISISKDDAAIKPLKIIGKTQLKGGKTQLNLFDSKNIIIDKDTYAVGDTVVFNLESKKIVDHLPFQKGHHIILTGGKHIGLAGVIEDIKGRNIIYKSTDGTSYETLKRYAFVIGKTKPVISLKEQ